MKTELIYLNDAYLRQCKAKVLNVNKDSKTKYRIILDKTIIQPKNRDGGDKGQLIGPNGRAIVKKAIHDLKSGLIIHYCKLEGSINQDEEVTILIDWSLRYNNMRKHSMFHLIYSCARNIMHEDFIAVSKISMDLSYSDWIKKSDINTDIINESEKMANNIVAEKRPVNIETLHRNEALRYCGNIYEKIVPKSVFDLRLVTIEGFNPDPCIGLHIKTTDEIGSFKIFKVEKYNDDLRLFADLIK